MKPATDVRLSIDIGGTFTDLVLATSTRWHTTKVLTTHVDPAVGVMTGLRTLTQEAAIDPERIGLILHGTTLATNALIERRGARTALITTAGHQDALEIGLENRFDQYDIFMQRPPVLVPGSLRFTVNERLSAAGRVLRRLTDVELEAVVESVVATNVDSVAVGLLHAYVNPEHEERLGEALVRRAPHLAISLSSKVCPEIREYERLSTTCANAYVKPLMARYLTSLEQQFRQSGIDCPVLMMTSGGGLTSLDTAREYPIRLVESGPAGGAMLAVALARRSRWNNVLAFDMGGTTAKLTFIDEGEPQWSRSFEVARAYRYRRGSGLPVRIPVIEMVEIGAGGGSIARVDRLHRIATGPDSAGSEPGPVAYSKGGDRPTVTDADLVLGKLLPERFAGGHVVLDVVAAKSVIQRDIALPLGLDVMTAAWGVSETVDENMAAAARSHAGEWGKSLADRTLLAFGGAAPLHAVSLARKLGIRRVVIPQHAGVGSAVGFLLAPVAFEVVRSRHVFLDLIDEPEVTSIFSAMRAEAMAVVLPLVEEGVVSEICRAYMRYVGQGFEVAVKVPAEGALRIALNEAFESAYRQLYGRIIPGQRIEILSWTLSVATTAPDLPDFRASFRNADVRQDKWFDGSSLGPIAVYDRNNLASFDEVRGPALVTEDQTTTVVTSNHRLQVDEFGQLMIQPLGEKSS